RLQPGRIERDAVGSVLDLMPTVLALAGAEYPKAFHGRLITPLEGRSLLPVLTGRGPHPEATRRGVLCWEHEGNRAVRMAGTHDSGWWKLVGPHREEWRLFNWSRTGRS